MVHKNDLRRGFYWLVDKGDEQTLAFYYKNPNTNKFGFGFNIADGCGFLPIEDLPSDTMIWDATVTGVNEFNATETLTVFAGYLASESDELSSEMIFNMLKTFVERMGYTGFSANWPFVLNNNMHILDKLAK